MQGGRKTNVKEGRPRKRSQIEYSKYREEALWRKKMGDLEK